MDRFHRFWSLTSHNAGLTPAVVFDSVVVVDVRANLCARAVLVFVVVFALARS